MTINEEPITYEELLDKIDFLLQSNIDEKYKSMLVLWVKWYDRIKSNLKRIELTDNEYLRAYCEYPDCFGIQVWEHMTDKRVWKRNVYSNKYTELNDDTTEILEKIDMSIKN